MATRDDLEFVAAMATLGREDRDAYRALRAEAWEMVQVNHGKQSVEERRKWRRNAS